MPIRPAVVFRAAALLLSAAFALGVAAAGDALGQSLVVTESGLLAVPVTVDGASYQFIASTGRSRSGVMPSLVGERGLQPAVDAAPGEPAFDMAGLGIGGQALGPVRAALIETPIRNEPGVRGVLGADVLSRFVVEVDVPGGRLALHVPGKAPAGRTGWGEVSMIVAPSRHALVQPRVGTTPMTAVIDTGTRRTTINWKAAQALGLAPTLRQPDAVRTAGDKRLEARASAVAYSFLTLTLGTAQWQNVTLHIADLPVFAELGMVDQPAMVMGMDLLGARRFILDYPGKRVLLGS
ncbi:MAG TPA: aspartyl protease family protein [Azospirillaceae bacterium]|nr:aspartyl protease family protein [Azospirillaceae bacterium]